MVIPRVWTFLWIFGFLFVLSQLVDSKKHRALHSHHRHRHHRKHPNIQHHHHHHLPSVSDFSRERNRRSEFPADSVDRTKLVASISWSLNETSTLFSTTTRLSNNEEIESESSAMKDSIIGLNFHNCTANCNRIFNISSRNESHEESGKISFLAMENATFNINVETTTKSDLHPNQILNISSDASSKQEETTLLSTQSINTSARSIFASSTLQDAIDNENITHQEQLSSITTGNPPGLVNNLQKLFGSTERGKNVTDIETPIVHMIRKKRELTEDKKPENKSLLNFNGPGIFNDPEQIEDVLHKRFKRDCQSDCDEDQSILSSRESSYLQDLEDSFPPSALEIQAQRSQDNIPSRPRLKREVANDKIEMDNEAAKGSEERVASTDVPMENNKSVAITILKDEGSTTNDDLKDVQKSTANPSDVDSFPNTFASAISYLRDDNSISRNGLDDIYPDIIEDSEHPSRLVQLIRTKRFGDAFVNPEAPDASYANEADIGRTVDEPYAEDNRFIDSVLSKVDYRTMDEYARSDNGRPFKSEIDFENQPEEAVRDKRQSTFEQGDRKKSRRKGHGNRKHRKKHRGKKKKKKKKRIKPKNSKTKRASYDDNRSNLYEMEEPEIISPHDGRRRRDYEDQDVDNYRFEARRNLREPEDFSGFSAGNYETAEDRRARAKRAAVQELKYYENVRETNGEQNLTSQSLLDRKAVGPIGDIKQLARELLDKANELRGCMNEGTGDGQTKESRVSKTLSSTSMVVRSTDPPSKAVQKTSLINVQKSTLKPFNASRRRELCLKAPASSNSKSSRSGSPKNLRVRSCGKKVCRKRKSRRKWGRWTDWSSCSVTCGRGRQIRWRHCIRSCSTVETEMEEKACQLPACAPGKFLGIFS